VRVVPLRPARPRADEVAVRQQHRRGTLYSNMKFRHHVRAVGVVRDLAEPLRLALGAVEPVRHVEPFERGVARGRDHRLALPDETTRRQQRGGHAQALGVDVSALARDQLAVDRGADEREVAPVEPQIRCLRRRRRGIGADREAREHPRSLRFERDRQVDPVDQKGRRAVVREADRLDPLLGAHRPSPSLRATGSGCQGLLVRSRAWRRPATAPLDWGRPGAYVTD
jgi:hypothetical protein